MYFDPVYYITLSNAFLIAVLVKQAINVTKKPYAYFLMDANKHNRFTLSLYAGERLDKGSNAKFLRTDMRFRLFVKKFVYVNAMAVYIALVFGIWADDELLKGDYLDALVLGMVTWEMYRTTVDGYILNHLDAPTAPSLSRTIRGDTTYYISSMDKMPWYLRINRYYCYAFVAVLFVYTFINR